jgi:hypothetical protein
MMNEAISEALSIAGQMGLDINDIRTIFPKLQYISDEEIDKCLKHGQVVHRLNVSAKLYGIIESPKTEPKDLIASERHLREVHTKGASQSGSQELLNLLRGTVPLSAPANYVREDNNEDEG